MNLFKSRSGESFIEVLIAVVIVGMSVAIALNLLLNTTDNTNANRNYLLADNLATEGIEAVRNMIYTNVLKHGVENADDCWLVFASPEFSADQCDSHTIVADVDDIYESYLTRSYSTAPPDLHWDLDRNTNQTLDLDASPEPFRLYTAHFAEPIADTFYFTNESTNNQPSQYYRSVRLELTAADEITVTARVLWREADRVLDVERTAIFNNSNFTE